MRLLLDIDHMLAEIEQAVPFGLILNELLSNSLKHAFSENRPGTIRVRVDMAEGVRVFSDDGTFAHFQLVHERLVARIGPARLTLSTQPYI